jgi:hypothetical protein
MSEWKNGKVFCVDCKYISLSASNSNKLCGHINNYKSYTEKKTLRIYMPQCKAMNAEGTCTLYERANWFVRFMRKIIF